MPLIAKDGLFHFLCEVIQCSWIRRERMLPLWLPQRSTPDCSGPTVRPADHVRGRLVTRRRLHDRCRDLFE